jgi:hypothetical protein
MTCNFVASVMIKVIWSHTKTKCFNDYLFILKIKNWNIEKVIMNFTLQSFLIIKTGLRWLL